MKKILEYSFRIAPQQELITLCLGDYSLTLKKGDSEETISYANITSVRINKYTEVNYKIYVEADGHDQITIPNCTFLQDGKKEIQSVAYSLFVRVLHHHLKDKSRADFKSGRAADKIWLWMGISAATSFIISFISDYLGYGLMNPYVQALILSAFIAIIIFVFSIKKLPKSYNPSNIPLRFLP